MSFYDWLDLAPAEREKLAEIHFLHVHNDGREEFFTEPPPELPVMKILRFEGIDFCWRRKRLPYEGAEYHQAEHAPPHGERWRWGKDDGDSHLYMRDAPKTAR